LQKNEPFLTRARAILYQIATPDAEFLNLNTGSLNKKAAESDKFLYFPKNNALDNNNILGICGILLKRIA
jgi:hypothetical protein